MTLELQNHGNFTRLDQMLVIQNLKVAKATMHRVRRKTEKIKMKSFFSWVTTGTVPRYYNSAN